MTDTRRPRFTINEPLAAPAGKLTVIEGRGPVTAEQHVAAKAAMESAHPGTMMSGPSVQGFREGWALPFLSWGKAHYFRRRGAEMVLTSLCRRKKALAGKMFEPGNWTRCELCDWARMVRRVVK